MKEIIISSPKFGTKSVLVDDEDYEYLSKYKWCLAFRRHTFYAERKKMVNRKTETFLLHRVVVGVTDANVQIDHVDHNGLNCQKSNLRKCTNSKNNMNKKKTQKKCSSKYKGVNFCTRKRTHTLTSGEKKVYTYKLWASEIKVMYKKHHIGYFNTEEEAALAYDEAAKKYHGEFASLNFPISKPS